jgi:hypothetical protein
MFLPRIRPCEQGIRDVAGAESQQCIPVVEQPLHLNLHHVPGQGLLLCAAHVNALAGCWNPASLNEFLPSPSRPCLLAAPPATSTSTVPASAEGCCLFWGTAGAPATDPVTRPASASSTVSASTSDLLLDGPAPLHHASNSAWGGGGATTSGAHRSAKTGPCLLAAHLDPRGGWLLLTPHRGPSEAVPMSNHAGDRC